MFSKCDDSNESEPARFYATVNYAFEQCFPVVFIAGF